jgi:TPP-dependent trihydroxycyclohexane-1,2-dione (THcHDO) dehydratase
VHVAVDPAARVPGNGSWWDVPVSEISEQPAVQQARKAYEHAVKRRRPAVP